MIIFSKDFLNNIKKSEIKKYILKKMNLQDLSKEETKRLKELGLAKDKFEYMERTLPKTNIDNEEYSGYDYKIKRTTAEDGSIITIALINTKIYNNQENKCKKTEEFNVIEMLNSDETSGKISIPNAGINSVINIYRGDKLLISWDCDFSEEFEDAKQLNPNEISFDMNVEGNYLTFNLNQASFAAGNYQKKEINLITPPVNLRSLMYLSELGFSTAVQETLFRNVSREIAKVCRAKSNLPSVKTYPKNIIEDEEEKIKINRKNA